MGNGFSALLLMVTLKVANKGRALENLVWKVCIIYF